MITVSPECQVIYNAVPINETAVRQRYDAWRNKELIQSAGSAIGSIVVPAAIRDAFFESDAAAGNYHMYRKGVDNPRLQFAAPLFHTFRSLMERHCEESGLDSSELTILVWAGQYREGEPLHVDTVNFPTPHRPEIVWTHSLGAGATRTAKGPISLANIGTGNGDLPKGLYKTLQIHEHPDDSVVNFLSEGDIHAGSLKRSPRLFLRGSLLLASQPPNPAAIRTTESA